MARPASELGETFGHAASALGPGMPRGHRSWSAGPEDIMEALLISTGVVALAEIGDKTQLLSLVLAARFKEPVPIIFGILVATLANHALAGAAGAWVSAQLGPELMRWVLGLSFLAMAGWMLVPDTLDEDEAGAKTHRLGVFWATTGAFFLAEMADKTQIATVALAARFDSLSAVVLGTTLGMMIANVPVVLLGEVAAKKLPTRIVHAVAAMVFAGLGVAALWGVVPDSMAR
jgi:putative Ca2+/H+ antiporter (TMEM165/GDT1 family)